MTAGAVSTGATSHLRLHVAIGLGACIAAAICIWLTFYPGILTPDSVDQYRQARTGQYHNWYPPVMSLVLAGLIALGGDIAALLLVQACVGVLGMWWLAWTVQHLLRPSASPTARSWAETIAALVLLLPVSPLLFHLVTFWKDTWVAIGFVYAGVFTVWLLQNPTARPATYFTVLAAFVVVLLVAVLARHNALVVVAAAVPILTATLRARGLRFAFLGAMITGLGLAVAPKALDVLASVHDGRPFRQVMALDLVGMCVLDPSLRAELPWTDRHLTADYAARYAFGDVGPIMFDPPLIVAPGYVADADALSAEYWPTIAAHPWLFARVKYEGVIPLLGLDKTQGWFSDEIYENEFGLAPQPAMPGVRKALVDSATSTLLSPALRWLAGVHGVWVAVALLLLAPGALLLRRTDRRAAMTLASLLAIPLLYYASYFVAATTPTFRFMYPSTLMVQVIFAAALAAAATSVRFGAGQPRADLRSTA